MKWLLCVILPPVALLMVGRPLQALLNIPLCLLAWLPGVVHAFLVVNSAERVRQTDRVVRAIQAGRAA